MKKILVILSLCVSATVSQAELVHQFKNPAFSGIGFSSHVLTIDSIEKSRRDAIEADKKAVIEGVYHYVIDYTKVKYGCKDNTKPLFWNQFGLDQLAHQTSYLVIAAVICL